MGRLKIRLPKLLKGGRVLRFGAVVATLILATVIYFKTSAVPLPSEAELKKHLESSELQVSSEVVNDFQHVYYDFGRVRVHITEGESNNTSPVTSGPLIAWTRTNYGDNQRLVYLYDVLTRNTKQLTFYGNASKLVMDGNLLVWEQHTAGDSKVYYYDGQQIKMIESEYTSLRPQVQDGVIAFAEHLGKGKYQVVKYYTNNREAEVVATGDTTNTWPRFEGDKLVIGGPF